MKKIVLLLFLFSAVFGLQYSAAETRNVSFRYDAAGNVIEKYKTIVLPRTHQIQQDDEYFDDLIVEDDAFGDVRVVIFPNPTRGVVRVEFQNKPAELSVGYRLVDTQGRFISSGTTTDYFLMLDLSGFASGVYFLSLTMDGRTEVYRIIKQ